MSKLIRVIRSLGGFFLFPTNGAKIKVVPFVGSLLEVILKTDITDLERTVIDSIRDFNKIGGFEELLNCLEGIHYLDEKKLKRYLDIYDTQGLYQKVGYLLDHYRNEIQLSKEFIEYCKDKVGKSRRYLVSEEKEDSYYNSEWELMVPEGLFEIREIK